jgi:hypothetical protein
MVCSHCFHLSLGALKDISIRGTIDVGSSITAPSSKEALDYLWEYYERHGISSQCIPALAVSLFLPWKNSDALPLSFLCRNLFEPQFLSPNRSYYLALLHCRELPTTSLACYHTI